MKLLKMAVFMGCLWAAYEKSATNFARTNASI